MEGTGEQECATMKGSNDMLYSVRCAPSPEEDAPIFTRFWGNEGMGMGQSGEGWESGGAANGLSSSDNKILRYPRPERRAVCTLYGVCWGWRSLEACRAAWTGTEFTSQVIHSGASIAGNARPCWQTSGVSRTKGPNGTVMKSLGRKIKENE